MAWRRCSRGVLLGAGGDLGVGNHRTRFDAADRPPGAQCEYGWDRLHNQFDPLAVCKYSSAARAFASAAVATPRAGRSRTFLWIIFNNVVVEPPSEEVICLCVIYGFAFLREQVYSSHQSDGW